MPERDYEQRLVRIRRRKRRDFITAGGLAAVLAGLGLSKLRRKPVAEKPKPASRIRSQEETRFINNFKTALLKRAAADAAFKKALVPDASKLAELSWHLGKSRAGKQLTVDEAIALLMIAKHNDIHWLDVAVTYAARSAGLAEYNTFAGRLPLARDLMQKGKGFHDLSREQRFGLLAEAVSAEEPPHLQAVRKISRKLCKNYALATRTAYDKLVNAGKQFAEDLPEKLGLKLHQDYRHQFLDDVRS